MTFTYDGTLDTDLEKVRLEIGDIDTANALFTDAEVNYKLAEYSNNIYATAAGLCLMLAARFARQADFNMDGQSVKLSQKSDAYRNMAQDFLLKSSTGLNSIVTTKIDGYQPTVGTIPDADDRNQNQLNYDYDVGRFDR